MKLKKNNLLIIIAEALEINRDKININSKMEDFEEWDSLGQLTILSKIDEELGGKAASIRELAECFSVKDFIDVLDKSKLLNK